jgi:hypothetical protein
MDEKKIMDEEREKKYEDVFINLAEALYKIGQVTAPIGATALLAAGLKLFREQNTPSETIVELVHKMYEMMDKPADKK